MANVSMRQLAAISMALEKSLAGAVAVAGQENGISIVTNAVAAWAAENNISIDEIMSNMKAAAMAYKLAKETGL